MAAWTDQFAPGGGPGGDTRYAGFYNCFGQGGRDRNDYDSGICSVFDGEFAAAVYWLLGLTSVPREEVLEEIPDQQESTSFMCK